MRVAARWALAVLVAATGCVVGTTAAPAAAETAGASYDPVEPCRLLDTREAGARLPARRSVRIKVAGRCGVDARATAAAFVITTVGSAGSGFATIFAAGAQRPVASNLNFKASTTVANGAVSALADGAIEVFVSNETHLVIDVNGAFVPAGGPVAPGRFVPTDPVRLLDTRRTGQRGTGDVTVRVPAAAAGATALAVNLTIVNAAEPGFLSVRRAGTPRTKSSAGNADGLNRTRALTTIVPVSAAGFTVFRSMPTDVVIDMAGWFTGPSAPVSADGLLVVQSPERVLDSRTANRAIHPGGTIEQSFGAAHAAVVANLTILDTVHPGYLTAYPAGTLRPIVSAVNASWRRPVANLAIMPLSTRGVAFYSNTGTRLLIDVVGWFTGAPRTATRAIPANTPPTSGKSVLLVSDSAFAGIRWYGRLDRLRGAPFFADLESCRRLIGWSCRGREGYSPTTAVRAIESAPGAFNTLVVTAGYNDPAGQFVQAIDDVIRAARRRGIDRVVWLDYRTDVAYVSPSGPSSATFASHNTRLHLAELSGKYPELEVVGWNQYSTGRTGWFTADRLHQTLLGAERAADYISRMLANLERRACPAPGPTAPGGWCAAPS